MRPIRSWREYVQSVSCLLSAQWRPIASSPLPSAQAYPKKIFLFNHYSRATYRDHGESMYSPVPVRCPRSDGPLLAPLCPPPRPVPRKCEAHQGKYKRKRTNERNKGNGLPLSSRRHEVRRGQEQWQFPPNVRLHGPRSLHL